MTLHAALTMPSYRSPIAIPNLRLNDRSVGLYARRPLSRRESHRCLIFLVRSTHPSLLEGPDVLDERPPVVLGQVPPGRHGAPAGADLPEQLPVGLVLDTLGGPVDGFGVQRHRRGAVALALGSVTGHAVDLGDLLALLGDLRTGRDRGLLALLGRGRGPGRLTPGGAREGEPEARDHDEGADGER